MSELEFTKMHGCGNDFIFLDCLNGEIGDLGGVAKRLCDRRFGIGADQLLTVHPSKIADFKMEIYNADGPWWFRFLDALEPVSMRAQKSQVGSPAQRSFLGVRPRNDNHACLHPRCHSERSEESAC